MANAGYNTEVWKTIPFAPNYEASSIGRIRRAVPDKCGRPMKVLTNSLSVRTGYYKVGMTIDGATKHRSVHSCVCAAFHGPRPTPKHHAAHNNGIKTDNRPENLRWSTAAENIADKKKHGTYICGEAHRDVKLTASDIPIIRRRAAAGQGGWTIAKDYGVNCKTIWCITTGKTWKHIP